MGSKLGDPSFLGFATEFPRTLGEIFVGTVVNPKIKESVPLGNGSPIMTLPGLVATDASLKPLERWLASLGYDPHGWNQGRNLGPESIDFDALFSRFEKIHEMGNGEPVDLIGQSLGGLVARIIAKRYQNEGRVGRIITLGTPGNPNVAIKDENHDGVNNLIKRFYDVANPEESEKVIKFVEDLIQLSAEGLDGIPITSIYSSADGIVGPAASVIPVNGPFEENIQIPGLASHCGMGFHPLVRIVIADRLALPKGELSPIDASKYGLFVKALFMGKQWHEKYDATLMNPEDQRRYNEFLANYNLAT